MLNVLRVFVAALSVVSLCASAQDSVARQEFAPKSGRGRVVVVISGQSGMAAYATAARQIADAGFDVVLVDGNDFWIKDVRSAWSKLKGVIAQAQAGSHALPGKAGVVGYSLGGASALTYAARMPELVATVVVSYPLTEFIKDPSEFIARTKVAVQMFAGTADTYKNCCLIGTARQLADVAAKAATPPMLTLHEYAGAGHGFNLASAPPQDQRVGQDAMERTIARLKQALPTDASK